MADLSRKTASIYINHAAADEALKKLQAQADKLTISIKNGTDAGKGMVNEITKLNSVKDQIAGVQRQIDAGLKPSFNQLQSIVMKTRAELRKMSESDAGFGQKIQELNKYTAEMNRLGTQIGTVKKESGGLKSLMGGIVPMLSGAAIGAGVISFLSGATKEALEANNAAGRFRGTLDNLGKLDSFERLSSKAEEMAQKFKYIDSPDVIGVFDKLITYGKLTESQIEDLTPVIIDFSVKSRISLDESASVIIKALEGSGRELKEYGVNITDAKTDSERLSVVMNELGTKVRGAADAFGSTTQGKIATTQQAIKDFKESIGRALLPVIEKLFSGISFLVSGFSSLTGKIFETKKSAESVFREAAAKNREYEQTIIPLINRYDELTSKSSLNTVEQVELNKAIETLGSTIPVAISEFDKYGKAIGINTVKAREFIALQQDILKVKNKEAIAAAQSSLPALEKELRIQDQMLRDTKKRADQQLELIESIKAKGFSPSENTTNILKTYNEAIARSSEKIAELQSRIKGTKGLIDELSGNPLMKPSVQNAQGEDPSVAARRALLKAQIKESEEAYEKLNATDKKGQQLNLEQRKKLEDELAALDNKRVKSDDNEASRRAEALRKAAEDAKRLQEIWKDFSDRIFDPVALNQDDPVAIDFKKVNDQARKDTALAKELFDKRTIDYKQYSDSILRIEEIRLKGIQDIRKKYNIEAGDPTFMPGLGRSLVSPLDGGTLSDNTGTQQQIQKDKQRLFRNSLAGEELGAITTNGKKRLEAQLRVLELQKAAELANKDLTENEKLLIEEKYRDKRMEAESSFQAATANMILEVAHQVADVFSAFSQLASASDENKLAENQRLYDEDKNKLDRNLRQKLVSQKEYDRQLRALDDKKRKEDAEIKRKQFERDKQVQMVQAIIAGASAVINAMKAPPPLNFIFAGLASAMVAAQIATIASQKTPQFARGGLLDGPAHSQGGMPILNQYGKKVAEVEGGEVILSKKTVRNNWDLVSNLLASSMYGNGSKIIPYNVTRPTYHPMNYSGLSRSLERVRHFEKGGIIPGGTTEHYTDPVMHEISNSLKFLNDAILNSNQISLSLNEKLSTPFKAYSVLSEINANQEIMDRIKSETTMQRN